MKKTKIASMDSELPRTPKEAMAPKQLERTDEDLEREGMYDLEHLMRAEEIKGDEKRMEWVRKAHSKKSNALKSIADLKTAAKALAHEKQEEMKAKAAQPRQKTRYPEREK